VTARTKSAQAARARRSPKATQAQTRRNTGKNARPSPPRPAAPRTPQPLARGDWAVGALVSVASLVLFLVTFSGNVALGDGPETVSGVRTAGVLHAPGYAIYALVARAFADVVHFGSWSFRVNLFSVVCATLTIAGVYFVARGLEAARVGAALGSLVLATTASFWFNASFAKHYAFSTLLMTLIAVCVVAWRIRPRNSLLIAAAAIAGLSVGASWQETFVFAVGVAALVVVSSKRPRPRVLGAIAATFILGVAIAVIYTMWRAASDPGMNFGDASSLGRFFHLVTNRDFGGAQNAHVGNAFTGIGNYLAVIVRDVGLGAIVLAGVGGFDVYQRRRLDQALFFGIAGLGTIIGRVATSAGSLTNGSLRIAGFYTSLAVGGQLVGAMIVFALLAALGTSWLVHKVGVWASKLQPGDDVGVRAARVTAIVVLAVALVLPSVLFHYRPATHRIAPLADQYGDAVLRSLPPNAVVIASGWEFAQPMIYRQLVDHERPDVAVLSADFLTENTGWYRDQIVHRFHLDPALAKPPVGPSGQSFVSALALLRKTRPVFVDAKLMTFGRNAFGWEDEGLVGRIVDGLGPHVPTDLAASAAALHDEEQRDGMLRKRYARFPNTDIYYFHLRAHVELAKAYALKNDLDGAATELERVLPFAPKNTDTTLIDDTRAHAPNARAQILGL
jgi:hypothetical protein